MAGLLTTAMGSAYIAALLALSKTGSSATPSPEDTRKSIQSRDDPESDKPSARRCKLRNARNNVKPASILARRVPCPTLWLRLMHCAHTHMQEEAGEQLASLIYGAGSAGKEAHVN